jgi:type I restriction enzyme S subunit
MTNNSNPQEWKECKLGEICCDVSYGYTESASLDPIGPKFLRITDIVPGRVNWETVPYCKISSENRLKYQLQEGDIVIARTGATTGYNYTIKSGDIKHDSVFASYLIRYRVDKKKADPFFIGHLLTSTVWQGFVEGVLGGSAQPGANAKQFADFEILLPPLSEQRAIAGVLSSLDDKIDLLHRQNKTLEGMAEALWRKMFVEEADPGWKKGKLGDIAEETIGGDWGEDTQSNELIPIICLRGVDLQNIKESGFSSEAPIRFIKPTSLEKRTLHENEILIAGSGIGPIGKSIPINSALLGCYSYPVIYSNFCKRLRTESKEMAYFIEFMIYQFYKEGELDQFHMGTSVPNFNLKDFLNFEVSVPPRDIVSLFSSFLTDWYNKKFTNQIRTLSILRDTLLPKLMSGEVRVRI